MKVPTFSYYATMVGWVESKLKYTEESNGVVLNSQVCRRYQQPWQQAVTILAIALVYDVIPRLAVAESWVPLLPSCVLLPQVPP